MRTKFEGENRTQYSGPESNPDFYLSRIPDLGSRISDLGSRISGPGSRILKQQQKRGVKKISCHIFFCSHKFYKLKIIFFWKCWKKILARIGIIELFAQEFVTNLSKIWVQNPGSGKKTYSRSRSKGQKGTESGIRIRNTGLKILFPSTRSDFT